MKRTVLLILALVLFLTANLGVVNAEAVYPIVTEPTTLTMLYASHSLNSDVENLPIWKQMEELTGIHIDLEVVPYSAINEKINLRMASATLPDIIMGYEFFSDAQLAKFAGDGDLLMLDDLIEQYAPDIKARLEEYPNARNFVTLGDGHIYCLPQYSAVQAAAKIFQDAIVVNTAWCEKLGIEIPQTYQEFEDMLYAFKTQDPNGNGEADEIPLIWHPNQGMYGLDMFSSFGFTDDANFKHHMYIDPETGTVQFAPTSEGWKTALKYFRKWYQDGLIEQENFTLQTGQVDAKIREKPWRIGVILTKVFTALVSVEQITSDYAVIPPLATEDGTRIASRTPTGGMYRCAAVLTRDNSNPEASIRWLDYFFTEYGSINASHGQEGVSWKYDESGKIVDILPTDPDMSYDQLKNANSIWTPGVQPEGINMDILHSNQLKIEKGSVQFPYMTEEYVWPKLVFSADDAVVISLYEEDIHQYVVKMMAHFMIDKNADIDAEWDSYCKNLDSIGLQEVLQIYRDRYDMTKS